MPKTFNESTGTAPSNAQEKVSRLCMGFLVIATGCLMVVIYWLLSIQEAQKIESAVAGTASASQRMFHASIGRNAAEDMPLMVPEGLDGASADQALMSAMGDFRRETKQLRALFDNGLNSNASFWADPVMFLRMKFGLFDIPETVRQSWVIEATGETLGDLLKLQLKKLRRLKNLRRLRRQKRSSFN